MELSDFDFYNSLDFLSTGSTSIFLVEDNGDKKYLNNFSIKRIMLKTNRVYVGEILLPQSELLLDKARELHVRYYDYGERDNYENGKLFAKFANCKVKQLWIPDVVIINPADMEAMMIYAILSCDIEIMKNGF